MDPANEIVQNNREEPLLPELVHTPLYVTCYPEHSPQPSLLMPSFAFGPLVLVPVNGPAEFWFNPYSVPASLVFLPEVHPNWCPVHSHQLGNPELVLGGAPQQVSEQLNITPALLGNEQIEEKPKSEEDPQKNKPDKDKLQTNNTDDETKSEFPPGSLTYLDEEELSERAFEEYMTIMDSLSPKVQREGDKDEEMEKLELELMEYVEKLSSENFIRNVEATLDAEFLNSLLSSDPEPAQLLALENQEQKVKLQEHPPSADIKINPGTEETSTVESALNADYLDLSLISDLEAIDFPPVIQLQQEALDLIPEQYPQPPSADSNSDPVTDAASTATSHVEETVPLQRAQSLIFDPPDTKPDTNHDGQNSPLSMSSLEPLPTDALTKYYNSVDAMSPLYYDGSIFKDYNQSLQFLENIFSDDSPTPALEARGNDGLVEEPAAIMPTGDVSEETSMSLSNLAGTQSPQIPAQKLEDGPQPADPPASESPSTTSVSGANVDPHAIAVDEPVPSFRADLLTVTPTLPASPPAQSVLASPPAQIREPEEQRSPKNINLKSPCLEDYPASVQTNSSFVADSLAESCDPQIDANLSDSVTVDQSVEQSVEPPKELQASPESELKRTTNKVQTRRNQRPTDQTQQQKARLTDESIIERTEEKKPSEKSAKKTAKLTSQSDGVMYKKQKRRSYRGRQLFQREESHFEERSQATKTANTAEQFSQIGEVGQHQNLADQVQTLNVDGGEKCEANNSNLGTQIGAENALLTKMTQEEKVERLKSKEEVQITSFVRITRSQSLTLITEERVQRTTRSVARTRGKVKHSEMNRSTMKSSPKTDIQDNKQKNATKLQTLPVSIKDKVSGDCSPVPLTRCSLQSPRVRINTRSQKDSLKGDQSRQESPEGLPNEINKSPSVKSCEKKPYVTPALSAETRQQSKTVASSEGGVMGTETRDFYSLRSKTHKPNVSKGTGVQENKEAEARRQPSNPKPSPEQTAGVKAEDGRGPVLASSPMKRYRHECGASEEIKAKVNEMISLSPTKRGRWKRRVEVNSKRDEGKAEVETAFRKPSPPSTRSQRKVKDFLGTLSAHDGGKRNARETTRCRPSRHAKRLPTKYKDFILLKTKETQMTARQGEKKKKKNPKRWQNFLKFTV